MDTSFVEFNDDENYRSSSDSSSVGFSFTTAIDLKKNLTEAFDKQVDASNDRSSSHCGSTSSLSVVDRIAQFETAAAHAKKPPRPMRPSNNIVPENRVAVYLRIRPPRQSGKKGSSKNNEFNTIEVLKPKHPTIYPTTVRTYPPPKPKGHSNREIHDAAKEFEFHQVLEPKTTQNALYSTVAAPMIQSLFDSYTSQGKPSKKSTNESALLFSYGVTNAGKTHTILGDVKSKDEATWGVIPRAITDVFDRIQQLPIAAGRFDPYISIFEIYNENVYDLIPKKSNRKHIGPIPSLQVRERQGQTVVRGLTRHKVKDARHGIDLVIAANNKRHTSSNNLNSDSSRSHCICQIQVVPRPSRVLPREADDDESVVSMSGYSTDEEVNYFSKSTMTLWVVDLAGSERSKRTGLDNSERQKESSLINKSLMTLMRCLTVMRETGRQSSASVVPYRESKLTHVFMSHLSGKSAFRTAMVVNVNPAIADFDETQHVLSYASQARLIHMDPEDLDKKRKLCFGDEYDMNGRKKAKLQVSSITGNQNHGKSIFSKVAKKLSPKKLIKKLSPRKNGLKPNAKKRQGEFSNKQLNVKSRTESTTEEPIRKRMKHPPPNVNQPKASTSGKKEIEMLQKSLTAAKSEIETLRSEKGELVAELQRQETQIRNEVAEEMEACLRITRERNQEELEKLRSQLSVKDVPCRSARKVRMDKAEQYVEELVDKVHECEEEMVRMRKTHAEEIAALESQVKNRSTPTSKNDKSATDSKKIAGLEKELAATKDQLTRLEKSKVELIENYEKLLREQGDSEESPSRSSEKEKKPVLRSKVLMASSKIDAATEGRAPLVTISGNTVSDQSSDRMHQEKKGERWIFPTKPSGRDHNGTYKKPAGKAPSGREWDRSVGAWRLKSIRNN